MIKDGSGLYGDIFGFEGISHHAYWLVRFKSWILLNIILARFTCKGFTMTSHFKRVIYELIF